MKRFVFLVAALLSTQSAIGAETIPAPPVVGNGHLVVYRAKRWVNCCVAPMVYIDSTKTVALRNGSYLTYELSPGGHTIQVGDGSNGFGALSQSLQVEPGETYYFQWSIGPIRNLFIAPIGGIVAMDARRKYQLGQMPNEVAQRDVVPLTGP